jgi:hypothetical protein
VFPFSRRLGCSWRKNSPPSFLSIAHVRRAEQIVALGNGHVQVSQSTSPRAREEIRVGRPCGARASPSPPGAQVEAATDAPSAHSDERCRYPIRDCCHFVRQIRYIARVVAIALMPYREFDMWHSRAAFIKDDVAGFVGDVAREHGVASSVCRPARRPRASSPHRAARAIAARVAAGQPAHLTRFFSQAARDAVPTTRG